VRARARTRPSVHRGAAGVDALGQPAPSKEQLLNPHADRHQERPVTALAHSRAPVHSGSIDRARRPVWSPPFLLATRQPLASTVVYWLTAWPIVPRVPTTPIATHTQASAHAGVSACGSIAEGGLQHLGCGLPDADPRKAQLNIVPPRQERSNQGLAHPWSAWQLHQDSTCQAVGPPARSP